MKFKLNTQDNKIKLEKRLNDFQVNPKKLRIRLSYGLLTNNYNKISLLVGKFQKINFLNTIFHLLHSNCLPVENGFISRKKIQFLIGLYDIL